MAILDALELIDQDWPSIEPILPVSVLGAVVREGSGLTEEREEDAAEAILREILPAMPPDHVVWRALRDSGNRFQGKPPRRAIVLVRRCVENASEALADPDLSAYAAADFFDTMAVEEIRRHGVIDVAQLDGSHSLDAFKIDADGNVPTFIFASMDPPVVYDIVVQLHELLGGFHDAVGAISWWLTPNAWLAAAPAELLGTGRHAEIVFAADQLANDNW
jgi:hypothetical protein